MKNHVVFLSRRLVLGLSLVVAGVSLFDSPSAQAATDTWSTTAITGTWNNAANWSDAGNTVPASGDTLVFGASPFTSLTDNLMTPATYTLGGITFTAGASAYTITSGTANVNGFTLAGAITDNSINLETINDVIVLSATETVNISSQFGMLTLSGSIAGASSGLTETGAGLLVLSDTANTFTGPTTVNGGTLSIGADTDLGTAPGSATPGSIVLNGGALRATTGITTITANRGIALGSGTGGSGTIDVGTSVTGTYNGIMANNGGTDSFVKTGLGTLTLGGSNTYTGSTTVNQGALKLDFSQNLAPATNIINSASGLVMSGLSTSLGNAAAALTTTVAPGASLTVVGNGAGTAKQTFNGLTLNPGLAYIATTQTSSSNVLLNLGAITNAGGAVDFTLGGTLSATTNAITTTSLNSNGTTGAANGILGGWAVYGTTAGQPTAYASVDASGDIVAYTGYTGMTANGAVIASGTNTNVELNSSGSSATATLAGTGSANNVVSINTLTLNTGANTTVNMAAGDTLRLGANGGLMVTYGNWAFTIGQTASTGTLTAGGAPNTSGTINVLNDSQNGGITINSVIANNGSGTVSLALAPTNAGNNSNGTSYKMPTVLNGANTYSGGTLLDSGIADAGNIAAFGTGTVTVLNGAQAYLGVTGTYANAFNIAGAGYSSSGAASAVHIGASNTTLSGTITLLSDATIGAGTTTGNVISGPITGGYNITFGDGAGALALTGVNTYTGNTAISAGTLTVAGAGQLGSGSYAGNISNAGTFVYNSTAAQTLSGIISGGGGLTLSGTGTLTLSGANTYTGATTVSGGILNVTGAINSAKTANVGQVLVGNVAGGAELLIAGGTVNATSTTAPSLLLGSLAGANGSVIISSGTLNTNTELWLSSVAGAYGSLTLNGGTATIGSWLALARGGGTGILNVNGGSLTVSTNNITIGTIAGGSNQIGVATLTGGTTSIIGSGNGVYVGEITNGVLNVSGNAVLSATGSLGVTFTNTANTSTGILNLNGGTIKTSTVKRGNATGTTATLNFGGGTLTATGNSSTFLSGLTNAFVQSGGGTIDNGGNTITISQALLAPANSGVTAISLSATGTGYIDTPLVTISGGTLATNGVAATAVANINYATGQVTGITITNPGNYTSLAGLTVAFTGGTNSASVAPTVNTITTAANTSGGMTFQGAGTTALTGTNTYTGNTTINAGSTLQLGSAGTTGALSNSSAIVDNGTLAISRTNAVVQGTDFSGAAITGTGGFSQVSTGTTTLNAANTYTGPTTVSAGTLQVGNGSAGSLSTSSALSVSGGATLAFDEANSGGQTQNIADAGTVAGVEGSGITNTLSGIISGTGGFTQSGPGTTILTASNTYTGATTINGGTLNLGGGGATGSISSSSALALGGGILSYTVNNGGTQTFNGLSVNSGASAISVSSGDTVSLGAISSRTVGGTVDFNGAGAVDTSGTSNTNGILGGYATVGGTTWAVAPSISGGAITGLASYYTTTTGGTTASNYASSANVDVTSSPALSAAVTVNSLRFNTAAAETLTLATTGTDTIGTGGILVTANVGNNLSTITSGTLEGPSGGDLVVIQNNTSNGLTIGSAIVSNTSASSLTMSGAGTLTLTGDNTYTGSTYINSGTLSIGGAGALGGGSYSGNIVDNGVFSYGSSISQTLGGVISGGGSVSVSAGTLTLSASNTYSGGTTLLSGGTVDDNNNNAFGTGAVTLNGGTLKGGVTLPNNIVIGSGGGTITAISGNLTPTGTLSGAGNLVIGNGGQNDSIYITFTANTMTSGTITLNGGSGTGIARLESPSSSSAVVDWLFNGGGSEVSGTYNFGSFGGTGSYNAYNQNNGQTTLYSIGANGHNATFSGAMGQTGAGQVLSFLKVGTGTETFSGANSYTGTTTIDNGSMIAGANVSVSANGPFGSSSGAIVLGDATTISSATAMNPQLLIGGAFSMARNIAVGANNNALGNASTTFTIGGSTDNASTFSGNIALDQNLTISQVATTSGHTLTISGTISSASSAQGVTFAGPGSMTLTAANTYTGPTAVTGGALTENSTGVIAGSSFTLSGGASATLSGVNTYTGATAVNGGILSLTGAGSINGSSGITINGSGATELSLASSASVTPSVTLTTGTLAGTGTLTNVTVGDSTGGVITNAGGALTIGTLTFDGVATLNLTSSGTNTAPDIATTTLTTGSTNAGGDVTINAANSSWTNGIYDLISYSGSVLGSGTADFLKGTISGLGTRQSATLVDLSGIIGLSIAGDLPEWTGAYSGNWTTDTIPSPKNWQLQTAGTPTDYVGGDTVLFNDTATGTTTVNIFDANVAPASTTFNNNVLNYTITSGSGFGISGGLLVKSGSASTTIDTANSYSGGTTLNAGTLVLNTPTAIGTGPLTITGGTIDSGSSVTLSTNNTQNWNGSFAFAGSTNLNIGTGAVTLGASPTITLTSGTLTVGGAIGGTGNITTTGAGTLVLNGASTFTGSLTASGSGVVVLHGADSYSGGTILNAGTLDINNSQAIGSGPFTIAGGTIDNTSGGAITLSTFNNLQNWNSSFTFGGSNALNLGTGAVTLGVSNPTLTINGSGGLTVGGSIGDGGHGYGITKAGAGTLTLNGSSSYSGGTHLNSGILVLGNGYGLGTGTLYLNGGSLENNNGATVSNNIQVSGSGSQINAIGGNVTLTGTLSGSGYLTIGNPGALVSDYVAFAANTMTSGTITMGGGNAQAVRFQTATAGSPNVAWIVTNTADGRNEIGGSGTTSFGSLTGNGYLSIDAGSTVSAGALNLNDLFSGVIDNGNGAGGLTKVGTGTMTLSGNNSYTGATTVSNGTLSLTGALGATAITVNGGTFSESSSGVLSSTGASLAVVSGTAALSGSNSYNGATTVSSAGTLNLTGTLAGATAIAVNGGVLSESSAGVINGSAASLAVTGGTATLLGANTYTGGSTVSGGGTLDFANNSLGSTGNITVNGGTLQWASGNTQDISSRLMLQNSGAATLDTQANNVTLATGFGGNTSSSLTKAGSGTLALTGSNTYSGGTTISAGVLQINTGYSMGASSGPVTINNGGTLEVLASDTISTGRAFTLSGTGTVQVDNGASYTVTGVLGDGVNPGSLTKSGSGTLNLANANNTYSGATNVNGGALIVAGALTGSVNVNSGGTLGGGYIGNTANTIGGNVSIASGGNLYPSFGLQTAGNVMNLADNLTLSSSANVTISLGANGSSYDTIYANGANDGGSGSSVTLSNDATDTLTIYLLTALSTPPASFDFLYTANASDTPNGNFAPNAIITGPGVNGVYAATVGWDAGSDAYEVTFTAVPEPGTWATLLSGIGMLMVIQRIRRRNFKTHGTL